MATSVAHGLAVRRQRGHDQLARCMLFAAAAAGSAGAIAALGPASHPAAVGLARAFIVGFDVVVHRGMACILEANAFGDLLPGLLWRDRDTYATALA